MLINQALLKWYISWSRVVITTFYSEKAWHKLGCGLWVSVGGSRHATLWELVKNGAYGGRGRPLGGESKEIGSRRRAAVATELFMCTSGTVLWQRCVIGKLTNNTLTSSERLASLQFTRKFSTINNYLLALAILTSKNIHNKTYWPI